MLEFDHVAIVAKDIGASVTFYVERFGAAVLYQDKTWALLQLGGGKVALVTPEQHPPHVALRVDEATLKTQAQQFKIAIESHRDGTCGVYLPDPGGNVVELIWYPHTVEMPGDTAKP